MTINTDVAQWAGEGLALVADDDDTLRTITSRMLEGLGFSVVEAEDGRQAVEIFAERADEIVVVVLDVVMPNMSGGEALRQMRQICPEVCAVMMSGQPANEVERELAGEHPSGFLSKPYGRDSFTKTIREALED